jgi:hypothetical protein
VFLGQGLDEIIAREFFLLFLAIFLSNLTFELQNAWGQGILSVHFRPRGTGD